MELVCDDPRVQDATARLHDVCEAEGAFLHDNLRMVVSDDEIWLEAPEVRNGDVLVSLPESCLPPLDAFEFAVVDDELKIEQQHRDVPQSQRTCMEQLLALYNATGKLVQHRAASPWFALANHRDILDKLVAARVGATRVEETRARLDEGDGERLLIDNFLGTRKLSRRDRDSGQRTPVLMPFIDFANHDARATPYGGGGTSGHRLTLQAACTAPGSDESLVRYAILDALDTYLNYDFVDIRAPFVRSVPAELPLDGFTIAVEGHIAASGHRPPPRMADLGPLVPTVSQRSETAVTLSHLLIPTATAPMAMRRVLNHAVRLLEPTITLDRLRSQVAEAERQLLEANDAFYRELQETLSEARQDSQADAGLDQLITLIEHQRAQLTGYSEARAA